MSKPSVGLMFFAPGTPAPQGSKTRTRYGMRESSKRVGPWREVVTQAAAMAADEAFMVRPLVPPYDVEFRFLIKRPKRTRAAFPVAPTIGDLDKLTRAVADALTQAGVIEDDRHIVDLTARKRWAADGEQPGVVVTIREVEG